MGQHNLGGQGWAGCLQLGFLEGCGRLNLNTQPAAPPLINTSAPSCQPHGHCLLTLNTASRAVRAQS